MKRLHDRTILFGYAFARDDRAVTAIEYALIAALIALVIIAGVTSVGTSVSSKFLAIGTAI
ncbi:MAG TPA: Flp family type IVb pilin [Acidocella sp.]|jgi:pilus assembly protein Flp/PilA|nr:Flp family type IVb pilin [Acidocella sp.]